MRKSPPDILITTPESLYLILSSGAREILDQRRGGDRRRDPRRRPVQARRPPGADSGAARPSGEHPRAARGSVPGRPARRGREERAPTWQSVIASEREQSRRRNWYPADRPLGDAAAAGAGRAVPRRAEAGVQDRRRRAREGARPGDRRPGRGHVRPGRPQLPQRGRRPAEGEPYVHVRSIWPAIYPELLKLVQEHNSTIIFVNARRAAERLAKRLNELANEEAEAELPATEQAGQRARRGRGSERAPRSLATQVIASRAEQARRAELSRSPGPTTARSPTRSGRSSRRC